MDQYKKYVHEGIDEILRWLLYLDLWLMRSSTVRGGRFPRGFPVSLLASFLSCEIDDLEKRGIVICV